MITNLYFFILILYLLDNEKVLPIEDNVSMRVKAVL